MKKLLFPLLAICLLLGCAKTDKTISVTEPQRLEIQTTPHVADYSGDFYVLNDSRIKVSMAIEGYYSSDPANWWWNLDSYAISIGDGWLMVHDIGKSHALNGNTLKFIMTWNEKKDIAIPQAVNNPLF